MLTTDLRVEMPGWLRCRLGRRQPQPSQTSSSSCCNSTDTVNRAAVARSCVGPHDVQTELVGDET